MLNYKQRVMDDLDALLADLQSTTAHISSYQQQQQSQLEHCSDHNSSRSSTPSPLPPPPPADVIEISQRLRDVEQPVYEYQSVKPGTQQHVESSSSSFSETTAATVQQEQGSSGYKQPPTIQPPTMSAVHSNLSELDQLLQDLNSAQFMAEVDRRNTGTYQGLPSITEKATATQHQMVNGTGQRVVSAPSPMSPTPVVPKPARMEGRVAVDTLLDELESAVPHSQSHHTYAGVYSQPQSIHTQHQVATSQTYQPQSHVSQSYASQNVYSSQPLYQELPAQPIRATSAATKELDDLMASLSEFKMTNVHEQVSTAADSPYSLPNKNRMQAGVEGGAASAQGDQLDSMLGSLQSDMNRQGVSTKTKGSCAACSKPVVGQVITALGKVWHVEHFVCAHCNEQLGTRSFYERDGRAFCERDYHTLFAPKCAYCNGPIVDKCVTALDKTWHPDHFFCAQCGRNFGEEGFHERDGNAYCRDDYLKLFAPKCGGCGRPIKDNYISALNRHWHPECFVCWDCHMPFGSMSFFDHDGLPYCEMHYHAKRGSLCAYCQKPITGRCITAMYKKFHPEHFVCAFCLKQLNKGTFKEQNDKPYCHPCFVKLFG